MRSLFSKRCTQECESPTRFQLALEVWANQWYQLKAIKLRTEMGPKAPIALGSLGFVGYEGLFIMERANVACRERKGLHLSYYGNYNSSWFDPAPLNCKGQKDPRLQKKVRAEELHNDGRPSEFELLQDLRVPWQHLSARNRGNRSEELL